MTRAPVSVVIPTFNNANLVTEAVDSVLSQTLEPAEIIVVDDGSTDDTADRLASYTTRLRYIRQANQGVSAARNRGVKSATQAWVAFLDADDVWHPRKLEMQLAAVGSHPELGLLGTMTFDWPAPELPDCGLDSPCTLMPVSWENLVVKNYFTTSSVIVRRDLLCRVGLFDTEMQGPEDHDRWLQLAEHSPVANLSLPLTGYRDQGGSLSKQAVRMQSGMQRILQKMDERQTWRGRRLLRRKAHGYLNYSCSYMHSAAGDHRTALGTLLKSFGWYPIAYRRDEMRMRLARLKLLAMILLRLGRFVPG